MGAQKTCQHYKNVHQIKINPLEKCTFLIATHDSMQKKNNNVINF